MPHDTESKRISVEEAVKAQRALRDAAGKGPEMFPIEAFIGMISDEIEVLREAGKSDEEIAVVVQQSSSIEITADDIRKHFIPAGQRHPENH